MKVPFSWLKEFVDIDVTAQELEEKLFSCGFEVEELIPLDAGISKVVVGKIVEMEKQEGTHLTKCVVDCGAYGHEIRISTGAANMKLGDCVPTALDGSTLPGGITIKARKMQGVESNGMLCSGAELGLNDDLFPGSEVYGLLILPEDNDEFFPEKPVAPSSFVITLNSPLLIISNNFGDNSLIAILKYFLSLFPSTIIVGVSRNGSLFNNSFISNICLFFSTI